VHLGKQQHARRVEPQVGAALEHLSVVLQHDEAHPAVLVDEPEREIDEILDPLGGERQVPGPGRGTIAVDAAGEPQFGARLGRHRLDVHDDLARERLELEPVEDDHVRVELHVLADQRQRRLEALRAERLPGERVDVAPALDGELEFRHPQLRLAGMHEFVQQVVVPRADLVDRAVQRDVEDLLPGEQRVETDADEERRLPGAGAGEDEPHPARARTRVAVTLEEHARGTAELQHEFGHQFSSAAAVPLYCASRVSATSRGTGAYRANSIVYSAFPCVAERRSVE
jgi:hypothetical protein